MQSDGYYSCLDRRSEEKIGGGAVRGFWGMLAGAGTGVYVRANTSTGSFTHPSSEAADTWVELTSARLFGQQRTTDGSDDWNGAFEYSFDGGSNIVFTTATFSITAVYNSV